MNLKLLLPTLTLLTFSILPAQACPQKAADPLEYQRRENNRCEGLKDRNIGGSFALISFVSRNFTNYQPKLSLKIPQTNQPKPVVKVQSRDAGYVLDNFEPDFKQPWFTFTWPTTILQKAPIPPDNLQATAIIPTSQPIYLPVILETASNQYEFVFWSSDRATIKTFEIKNAQNRIIYKAPPKPATDGEIKFTWNHRQVPKGRYTLRLVAEIAQQNQSPQTLPYLYIFEHNPDWLK